MTGDHDPPPAVRAVRAAHRLRSGLQSPTDGSQFSALYSPILDEVRRAADERRVYVRNVEAAYGAIVGGENPHLTSHDDLQERTGMGFVLARRSAAVLSDVGDLHECYDDDWKLYWARCDGFIKDACEDRRISLCRYFQMYDLLHEFQGKVIGWYVRRNRRQSQPFLMRELKAEYVEKIQEEHFPDKPVGEEWSRHIAARYLRTAQDSIVRSFDLTY